MPIIAPSMLSANFLNLQADIEMVNKSNADWFHIDVMDGLFVPNISFGPMIINFIAQQAKKPLDTHLMIVNPDRYIDQFAETGTKYLTVHYEACTHLHRTIHAIKQKNMLAGVSLNPHTPIHLLSDIIHELDLVLIMSVNPGFGGQKFIENTYQKINDLKNLILTKNSKAIIEVDGGVNNINALKLINAGADALVAGNYIFKSTNPTEAINKIKFV